MKLDSYGEVIVTLPIGEILHVSIKGQNNTQISKLVKPEIGLDRFILIDSSRASFKTYGPYDYETKIKISSNGNDVSYTFNSASSLYEITKDVNRQPNSFNLFGAVLNAERVVITPAGNPYLAVDTDVVHPSIIYIENGWNGYKYWMAYTPYPALNSAYENPCLCVSNDGITWIDLGINPLVAKPATGYNADTELFLSLDGTKLYLLFRERLTAVNNLKLMESTDGVTWSTPVTIKSGTIAGNQDYATPSLFWDYVNNRYSIYFANLDSGTDPYLWQEIHSTDLYSGWTDPVTLNMDAPPATKTYWHGQFKMLPSGQIIGVLNETTVASKSSGPLWWVSGDSSYLRTKRFDANSLMRGYRCCLVLKPNGVEFFQGDVNKDKFVKYTLDETGIKKLNQEKSRVSASINSGIGSALLRATFNAADSAIALPNAESGQVWTNSGPMGISGNKAYNATSGNSRAYVDLGVADFTVETLITSWSNGGTWLLFRLKDTSNYFRFGYSGTPNGATVPLLQKIVAGATVAITVDGYSLLSSVQTKLKAECYGTLIRLFIDDVLVHEFNDSFNKSETKVGVQAIGATPGYFDYIGAWE